MTVGRPCVEWEQGTKNAKANEDEGEEHLLNGNRDGMELSNLHDAHCISATVLTIEEVDTKNTYDEQGGTAHQHQGKLHG